jgi:3-oxoadipate enol-lactonase
MIQDSLARMAVGAGEAGRAEGSARQLEARRHHDTFERLRSLTMPVYICGGKYDGIAAPANLEAMHRKIAGSTMELFEGGHLFLLQDRAAWPKVIAFLLG